MGGDYVPDLFKRGTGVRCPRLAALALAVDGSRGTTRISLA
jgi:hypothetical protein